MVRSLHFQKHLEDFQPIPVTPRSRGDYLSLPSIKQNKTQRKSQIIIALIIFGLVYFFAPVRANILFLGADYIPGRNQVSRTDTMILMTVIPLKPYVGMLSIPRDLWVPIPGIGENRINTSYFFAEAAQRGSGPNAAVNVVRVDFGISIKYYILINMEGVIHVVDALGGVDVDLTKALGGLTAGRHHLTGKDALTFARERYSADDFSRMAQGQILIKSIIRRMTTLSGVIRSPIVFFEIAKSIKTNLPWWQIPRLALAVIRTGIDGIDNQVITREMVTPFVSDGGAQVLAPKWDLINPKLLIMFGQ